MKIAMPQSSHHRFRATIRDITGQTLQSLPIEMKCLRTAFPSFLYRGTFAKTTITRARGYLSRASRDEFIRLVTDLMRR